MRYLFLLAMLFSAVLCRGQNTVSSEPGTAYPFLQTMQAFVDNNEALHVPDSVKRSNLYQKLKEEITAQRLSESSFIMMYNWALNLTREQVESLFQLIDTSVYTRPEKVLADAIRKRVAAAETGKPFPNLVFTDTAGRELSIASLKGRIILIDAWSSWCGPCREQIPALRKLYRKYNKKGFEIIGVSIDKDKEKWLAAIQKDRQEWKQFCELTGWTNNRFAARFNIYAIPANFLIDRNGILTGQDLTPESIGAWLEKNQ